jgi:hypothetical protein
MSGNLVRSDWLQIEYKFTDWQVFFFHFLLKNTGQNIPLSTTLSSRSLNSSMVSVEATINSDTAGIETLLAEYFSGAKLIESIF